MNNMCVCPNGGIFVTFNAMYSKTHAQESHLNFTPQSQVTKLSSKDHRPFLDARSCYLQTVVQIRPEVTSYTVKCTKIVHRRERNTKTKTNGERRVPE